MSAHSWVKSTLGHGETMCARCFITNREAAVLGELNECPVDVDAVADGHGPASVEAELINEGEPMCSDKERGE